MTEKHLIFLIHGYTATINYMQPLTNFLEEQGYFVHNASMAGHDIPNADAFTPFPEEEFMNTYFDDWFASIEKQFLNFAKDNYKITLIGHSMGGIFSLKLAEIYPQHVHSIIALSAPIYMNSLYPLELKVASMPLVRLLHPLVKKFPHTRNPQGSGPEFYNYPPQLSSLFKNMRPVRKHLHKITAPILIIQVFNDVRSPNASPLEIARKVKSKHKILKMYTIQDPNTNNHHPTTHPETKEFAYRDIVEFIVSQEVLKIQ